MLPSLLWFSDWKCSKKNPARHWCRSEKMHRSSNLVVLAMQSFKNFLTVSSQFQMCLTYVKTRRQYFTEIIFLDQRSVLSNSSSFFVPFIQNICSLQIASMVGELDLLNLEVFSNHNNSMTLSKAISPSGRSSLFSIQFLSVHLKLSFSFSLTPIFIPSTCVHHVQTSGSKKHILVKWRKMVKNWKNPEIFHTLVFMSTKLEHLQKIMIEEISFNLPSPETMFLLPSPLSVLF